LIDCVKNRLLVRMQEEGEEEEEEEEEEEMEVVVATTTATGQSRERNFSRKTNKRNVIDSNCSGEYGEKKLNIYFLTDGHNLNP